VAANINTSILATLAYFDMFNYPLTRDEIISFMDSKVHEDVVEISLAELVCNGKVYALDGFYTLKNDTGLISRRKKGNKLAHEMLNIARKISGILIQFPYVRGVAVSGSLSKNYADESSDIDLFIITSANRLWIARTIMHVFKKLTFLVNKQHFFCMNYYIDEEGLEIIEKNIYTATEIVTLIAMEGNQRFSDFLSSNTWTTTYLPNKPPSITSITDRKTSWFKKMMELTLNNRLGDILDDKFRQITSKRWEKKTVLNKLNMRGVVMSMKAGKHYSKPDPSNYQDKLIKTYVDKVSQLTREPAGVI
jgi:predicted nucleotidyltransferase